MPVIKKLENGIEVSLSYDYTDNPSKCRGCGQEIHWAKTINDKFIPIDPDFKTSHFATCPQANKFKKPKQRGLFEK
jgi:hypothetical protein